MLLFESNNSRFKGICISNRKKKWIKTGVFQGYTKYFFFFFNVSKESIRIFFEGLIRQNMLEELIPKIVKFVHYGNYTIHLVMNSYLQLILVPYLLYELLITAILIAKLWNNIHSCQRKVSLFAFIRNLEGHTTCISFGMLTVIDLYTAVGKIN